MVTPKGHQLISTPKYVIVLSLKFRWLTIFHRSATKFWCKKYTPPKFSLRKLGGAFFKICHRNFCIKITLSPNWHQNFDVKNICNQIPKIWWCIFKNLSLKFQCQNQFAIILSKFKKIIVVPILAPFIGHTCHQMVQLMATCSWGRMLPYWTSWPLSAPCHRGQLPPPQQPWTNCQLLPYWTRATASAATTAEACYFFKKKLSLEFCGKS